MEDIGPEERLAVAYQNFVNFPMRDFTVDLEYLPRNQLNPFIWLCKMRGKRGTIWERGEFAFKMICDDFPVLPPKITFSPVIYHPNVATDGVFHTAFLNVGRGWRRTTTIKDIFKHLLNVLPHPRLREAVNLNAKSLFYNDRGLYRRIVILQAERMAGPPRRPVNKYQRKSKKGLNIARPPIPRTLKAGKLPIVGKEGL